MAKTQIIAATPGYPVLKSKAAQCRHLADFGHALALKHRHGSGDRAPFRLRARHRLAARTDEHLDRLVTMMGGMSAYCKSLHADPFNADACKEAMYAYLKSLAALRRTWRLYLPEAWVVVAPCF